MQDNIVKEMLRKISRRAKSWAKRNINNSKYNNNPYTDFGFLNKDLSPKNINQLKEEYKEKYNYKIGVLKNISRTDYIKTRDEIFVKNLQYLAEQTEYTKLLNDLKNDSLSKTMVKYYNGDYDALLAFWDSEQTNNSRTTEEALKKFELYNIKSNNEN